MSHSIFRIAEKKIAQGVSVGVPHLRPSDKLTGYNLYKLVAKFPFAGLGRKFSRAIWSHHNDTTFWTVTRSQIKKIPKQGGCGHRFVGSVWGVFTFKGVSETHERIIRSPLKKQWFCVEPPTLPFRSPLKQSYFNPKTMKLE
eukprot:Sdes_comp13213_c0_seq2m3101